MKLLELSKPVLVLTLIALLGVALVSVIEHSTKARVEHNLRLYKSKQLRELLQNLRYDNEPWEDPIAFSPDGGKPLTLYPVVNSNTLVAVVIENPNVKGYVGPVRLLIAVKIENNAATTVIGVRAAEHRETPGLGDKIDLARSGWITTFAGTSLQTISPGNWATQKDGGDFDQISGATVTSRAVIAGVHDSLMTLQSNQQKIIRQFDDSMLDDAARNSAQNPEKN